MSFSVVIDACLFSSPGGEYLLFSSPPLASACRHTKRSSESLWQIRMMSFKHFLTAADFLHFYRTAQSSPGKPLDDGFHISSRCKVTGSITMPFNRHNMQHGNSGCNHYRLACLYLAVALGLYLWKKQLQFSLKYYSLLPSVTVNVIFGTRTKILQ